MQCLIYSNRSLVGQADFIHFDPGMGCTVAPFLPSGDYEEIRPTVRAYSLLGSFADTEATPETKAHAAEVYQRCLALNLTAHTLSGEVLEPAGGITLEDYSEELDEDPYQATLFGLPRHISEKYFHDAIRQYYGETRQENGRS